MKIITEPSVYLVSSQFTADVELERFEKDEGIEFKSTTFIDSQNIVEFAGRVCYMSFAKPRPGGNKAYIEHILEVGHGSVLEHAVFGLLITGVSRSLTHELIRHRAGFGYSQLSQRYVDESECNFVLPENIKNSTELRTQWNYAIGAAKEAYTNLAGMIEKGLTDIEDKTLRRKRAREAARSVLPNCTETKIFVTGNARAWRHFIEMRGSIHADAEIQRLAIAVLEKLKQTAPHIFGDYKIENGEITTPYRKV